MESFIKIEHTTLFMRILIFSDLHLDGDFDKDVLANFIKKKNCENFDLVVNLGDVIRYEDIGVDQLEQNIKTTLNILNKIEHPLWNTIGNHEQFDSTRSNLEKLYHDSGLNSKFKRSEIFEDAKLILLDFEFKQISKNDKYAPIFSDESIKWLDSQVEENPDLPKIVFSHFPFVRKNLAGHMYHRDNWKRAVYRNYEEIFNVCNRQDVISVFAHNHTIGYTEAEKLRLISQPSWEFELNETETVSVIYSELEIENSKLTYKTYSRDTCFNNIELDI